METAVKKTTVAVPTYGSTVVDSAGRTGIAKFNPNTGQALTNPAVTSTEVRADNSATERMIRDMRNAYNADANQIRAQQQALAERRSTEVAGIKTEFDLAKGAQELGQKSDFAARATSLITSGGGFLGATQSQQGVLQNLKSTHETEKTALMSKREAAINAANQAYEDKDFALARELTKNAKDLQSQIYGMEKDFADQALAISRENRAKTEFDMGITDKKIQGYTAMSDEEYKNVSPQEKAMLDKNYFAGYTDSVRKMEKDALNIKTKKDAIGLEIDILDMRNKMAFGQKFTVDGITYTGLKQADSSGKNQTEAQIYRDNLNYVRQNLFSPYVNPKTGLTEIPKIIGSDGVPFITKEGFATYDGWQEAMRIMGMKRDDFINEFKGYLNPNADYKKYGLDQGEVQKITGQKASVVVSGSDVVLTD